MSSLIPLSGHFTEHFHKPKPPLVKLRYHCTSVSDLGLTLKNSIKKRTSKPNSTFCNQRVGSIKGEWEDVLHLPQNFCFWVGCSSPQCWVLTKAGKTLKGGRMHEGHQMYTQCPRMYLTLSEHISFLVITNYRCCCTENTKSSVQSVKSSTCDHFS